MVDLVSVLPYIDVVFNSVMTGEERGLYPIIFGQAVYDFARYFVKDVLKAIALIGVIFADGEIVSNLRWTQKIYDLMMNTQPINPLDDNFNFVQVLCYN